MVLPAVKEQILNDLEHLSPEQQRQAAQLVRGLVSLHPKGASPEDLLEVSGILDPVSAREMTETVAEGCELVDLDEWK